MRIVNVVGARPNFMKIGPIHRLMKADPAFEPHLLHTGQHYDERMSDVFFRELGLPEPDIHLGIGGGSHAVQTARIMKAFEEVVLKLRPDMLLVVGDVNSTLACSLVAAKLGVTIGHVEAGLRSFDREMPEEINRIVADSLSDHLFVTEQSGLDNLENEGVDPDRIHFVGNVMIDSLVEHRAKASRSDILDVLEVERKAYVLMTIHRPSNVDDSDALEKIFGIIEEACAIYDVLFPVHPRTQQRLKEFGFDDRLKKIEKLTICEPQGYLNFLSLMDNAAAVVTDSGGIQEETTYLGVPCLTLRENTERPSTVTMGTNELLSPVRSVVGERLRDIMEGRHVKGHIPPLWDGKAANRIVEVLKSI